MTPARDHVNISIVNGIHQAMHAINAPCWQVRSNKKTRYARERAGSEVF